MSDLSVLGLVYCERCGVRTGEQAGGRPQHCVECELFVCGACWDTAARRCAACEGTIDARPSRRGGLIGARRHLAAIRNAGAELDRLVAALHDPDWREEATQAIEPALLIMVRASAHRAEAETLLANVKGRSVARAELISRDLRDETVRLLGRLDDELTELMRDHVPATAAHAAGAEPVALPLRMRRPNPRVRVAAWTIGAVAFVVALLVFGPSQLPSPVGLVPAQTSGAGGIGSPTPEGAVLGATSAPSSRTDPLAAVAIAPDRPATFDEQRMDTPLDEDWQVLRGAREQITLVALPSAVDRSIRLAATQAGEGVQVCRPLAPAVTRVAVDLRLEDPGTTLDLQIATGGTKSATISISADTQVMGSGVVPKLATWYRFQLDLDPASGAYTWQLAEPDSPGEPQPAEMTDDAATASNSSVICLGVADGTPGVRALIDSIDVT